jgi:hypothetical protein
MTDRVRSGGVKAEDSDRSRVAAHGHVAHVDDPGRVSVRSVRGHRQQRVCYRRNLGRASLCRGRSGSYLATLSLKLILVAVSGIGALAHILVARRRPALRGLFAALALLAALGATFVGVLLNIG